MYIETIEHVTCGSGSLDKCLTIDVGWAPKYNISFASPTLTEYRIKDFQI